jgi:hypothetical protein
METYKKYMNESNLNESKIGNMLEKASDELIKVYKHTNNKVLKKKIDTWMKATGDVHAEIAIM